MEGKILGCMAICALPLFCAAQIGVVADFDELRVEMDQVWTEGEHERIYPPHLNFQAHAGLYVAALSFPTQFLDSLVIDLQDGVPIFPLILGEDPGPPVLRVWADAEGGMVTNTPPSGSYDPVQWVLDHYPPPTSLTSEELSDYIGGRWLPRKTLRIDLIREADLPAYWAAWSNRVALAQSNLASIDLGAVTAILLRDIPAFDLWVQVPEGVEYVGLYETSDLENPFPWTAAVEVFAWQSPQWMRIPLVGEMEHVLMANHDLDTDEDGLLDAVELYLVGTDPHLADSDNDGVSDWDEVFLYDSNPLSNDSDGDGLTDGDEVLVYKTNPAHPDTDRDGMGDGAEVGLGLNPRWPDHPDVDLVVGVLP